MPEPSAAHNDGQVFALLGATATGKSQTAVSVAGQRIAAGRRTEIVAIDAFTVYREMDIATAKPSAAIRATIRHHMVDVYTPDTEVTVASFQREARAVIDERLAQGIDLILVGGSGLYWRAVVDDLRFPPTDPATRQALEDALPTADAAYTELKQKDPQAAEAIEVNNYRRVIRALEVVALTGESFMAFQQSWEDFTPRYAKLAVAYLEPPPADLHAAIDVRTAAMLREGLLDEAARLRETWNLSRTARQAIGYAEAFAVLDGDAPAENLADAIAQRTRRYARRQRTWFRKDPRCVVQTADSLITAWGEPKSRTHTSTNRVL